MIRAFKRNSSGLLKIGAIGKSNGWVGNPKKTKSCQSIAWL
jgi:hypothetical protein